jgi:hypothetical protein
MTLQVPLERGLRGRYSPTKVVHITIGPPGVITAAYRDALWVVSKRPMVACVDE